MKKNTFNVMCLFLALPVASHAMLRTVAGKMPVIKFQSISMAARSMTTLSDEQRKAIAKEMVILQSNIMALQKKVEAVDQFRDSYLMLRKNPPSFLEAIGEKIVIYWFNQQEIDIFQQIIKNDKKMDALDKELDNDIKAAKLKIKNS